MLRFLLTHLLVVVVLACPYQCLAGAVCAADDVPGNVAPISACHCCHFGQPAEEPTAPRPTQDQHDCFCQGVTCDAPRCMADDFAPQTAVLDMMFDVGASLSPALLASTAHAPPREALSPTGWDICVGHCALLL